MTATTLPARSPAAGALAPAAGRSRRGDAVGDALALMWRNLLAYVRLPQLMVFSTIQPVMFVLLFRYVFGNSINLSDPSVAYVDYLMPGIIVQTAVFGVTSTGIGLAEDLHKGLIERFRSLPMARSAVLAGRTLADGVRNVFVMVLITAVGMLVGFRIHGGIPAYLAAMGLVLVFAFALSWATATIGLGASNAEAAQAAIFPLLFPLTFASSAFVDTSFMPGWLQAFANHQPVTVTVDAARDLVLGQPVGWGVVGSLAWSAGLLAVFAPLAVRRYRRAA
ncbi:MAG TPA: ABC transporter permease [Acidimicrobiales bacterium]|nr:ABC transporter permease [Acidimicrobiales bacterium]